jgi:hypothetical protein
MRSDIPFTPGKGSRHAQRYYSLVDHDAPTESRIPEWLLACGDPATAELLYNSNRTPVGLLYGGPR